MKLDIYGIVPAVFTPMHQNGEINLDIIDAYAEYLAKENVDNVFILGTAGEGCSLRNDERMQVAERWMKAAKDKVKNVIVQVGADNLADTKILASHAESIGATAIATIASFFFKLKGPKELAFYLSEVAKAAPNTPMLYYHVPVFTGVNINVKNMIDEIEVLGIKNFAGVKFTAFDMCDFGQCVDQYGDKYTICYGYDEQVIAGLFMGAKVCVGSTYNIAVKLYQRIFDACMNEDVKTAREEQFKSQRFLTYLFTVGFDIGVCKQLMGPITGLEMGPPRLPLFPSSKEKLDTILSKFKELGFYDWMK